MFTSKLLDGNIQSVTMRKVHKIPDHKSVILSLKSDNRRGSGYWKLNSALLESEAYRQGVVALIKDTFSTFENILNPNMLWDICKINIKEFSIKYAIRMSRERKKDIFEY